MTTQGQGYSLTFAYGHLDSNGNRKSKSSKKSTTKMK